MSCIISISAQSDFSIHNVPFGICSNKSWKSQVDNGQKYVATRLGDSVINLSILYNAGMFNGILLASNIFSSSSLNQLMECEKAIWTEVRNRIIQLFTNNNFDDANALSLSPYLLNCCVVPHEFVQMHLPVAIGDYTDFYSSKEHATNVGIMFRGVENALQPNWLHLPVGYHGRSSSVVLSGTDIIRPCGQLQLDPKDPSKGSLYGPTKALDFELEIGVFIGGPENIIGNPLDITSVEDRIFGVVLLNDWSARDIQAWEYVPLGPFTAKNFATSISPWVVTIDALKPFNCSTSNGPVQTNPNPLPYLADPDYHSSGLDINLTVSISPAPSHASLSDTNKSSSPSEVAYEISQSNTKYLYWNMKQQIVHHSVTGCPIHAGDLMGSGTISGTTDNSLGSLLELSWKGSRKVYLGDPNENRSRTYLEDGDILIMTGYAQGDGYRVGFGSVSGKILPINSHNHSKSNGILSNQSPPDEYHDTNNSINTIIDTVDTFHLQGYSQFTVNNNHFEQNIIINIFRYYNIPFLVSNSLLDDSCLLVCLTPDEQHMTISNTLSAVVLLDQLICSPANIYNEYDNNKSLLFSSVNYNPLLKTTIFDVSTTK
eukprot:gene6302-8681_t